MYHVIIVYVAITLSRDGIETNEPICLTEYRQPPQVLSWPTGPVDGSLVGHDRTCQYFARLFSVVFHVKICCFHNKLVRQSVPAESVSDYTFQLMAFTLKNQKFLTLTPVSISTSFYPNFCF